MPTPTTTVTIGAKSSTLDASNYITFRNLTNGTSRTVQCNSNGEAIVQGPPTAWVNGDVISVEVRGKYNKSQTATITKGGINVNLGTLTEDSSTEGVNL